MSYQVAPGDPIVTFDSGDFEKMVAIKLKAVGISTPAGLATAIASITTATCPGMSNTACQVLQTLAKIIVLT